jgi:hypothetical protein
MVHKGSEGVAKVGTSVISEIKDWNISESADIIDVTKLGDTARAKVVGLTSATGSMNCSWDETDVSGQGAMAVGSALVLNLYPAGDTTGDNYATCNVLVNEVGVSTTAEGVVERSISFEVNGAVTWGASA